MMQEFSRESNTAAPSRSMPTSRLPAIELKVLIEQMRERIRASVIRSACHQARVKRAFYGCESAIGGRLLFSMYFLQLHANAPG